MIAVFLRIFLVGWWLFRWVGGGTTIIDLFWGARGGMGILWRIEGRLGMTKGGIERDVVGHVWFCFVLNGRRLAKMGDAGFLISGARTCAGHLRGIVC